MSTDELIQRNVVVLPTGEVLSRALHWSQELASLGTEFVLGDTYRAHLSIYQAAYPGHNEEKLVAAIEEVAAKTRPFKVEMGSYDVFWETFVFWDALLAAELISLHHHLLDRLNPLREGKLLPIHQEILNDNSIPEGLRSSIREFGNPLCGAQHRPHITLTRLKDPAMVPRVYVPTPTLGVPLNFPVSSLHLTEVGPHGTCPRILGEFPLTDGVS